MMRSYAEKRDHYRMSVRCTIRLQAPGAEDHEEAELRDLSATGLRFLADRELEAGARLRVTVPSGSDATPPLCAEVSVVRSTPEERGFEVAAAIESILSGDDASVAQAS